MESVASQEIGKCHSAEEKTCSTPGNGKALFWPVSLAEQSGSSLKAWLVIQSYTFYKETLLCNSKPLCVSGCGCLQAKGRPMVPRVLGPGPMWGK